MSRTKPRYKKKRIEFSKALAVTNTIVYLLVLLFCLTLWFKRNDFPSEIFNAVTAQYATTLSVYMIKAGVENYQKINVNREDENYDRN